MKAKKSNTKILDNYLLNSKSQIYKQTFSTV